jgi:hypothetical protein
MTKDLKAVRERAIARIKYIEHDWNTCGYPPLMLTTGWSQVEALQHKGRRARQQAIRAGVMYGEWRGLHDMIGSPYGHPAMGYVMPTE